MFLKSKDVKEEQPEQGFNFAGKNKLFKYFGNINSVGFYKAQKSLIDVTFGIGVNNNNVSTKIEFTEPQKQADKAGMIN